MTSVPFPWSDELIRLDKMIRPIAEGPVTLTELKTIFQQPDVVDYVGIRQEAHSVLLEILRAVETSTEEERRSIRLLVPTYKSFFWAVQPPDAETPEKTLRRSLVHFALIDQYPDPRDAILWLESLCQAPDVLLERLAAIRREVAELASDDDQYGFGSTRSMLLKGYGSSYGKRGAPESGC